MVEAVTWSWLVSHVGLKVREFNTYNLLLWHPTARNCDVGDHETQVTPRPEEAGYGLKLHSIRPSGANTITLQICVTRLKAPCKRRQQRVQIKGAARLTCTLTRNPKPQSWCRRATTRSRCSHASAAAFAWREPSLRHCRIRTESRRSPGREARELGARQSEKIDFF